MRPDEPPCQNVLPLIVVGLGQVAFDASETRTHSQDMQQLLANELPELDERENLHIAAVLRCLLSSQAWLRMREEYGVPGTESGPVVAWVIELIIRELRAGNTPSVR